MERVSELLEIKKRWVKYQLPESLKGKTFLDVGCWGGGFLEEAVLRGASKVVGVDVLYSKSLELRQAKYPNKIDFFLIDVLSPTFLALPVFDVVFCGGVLYHVSEVIDFLRRLLLKTGKLLVLETAFTKSVQNIPVIEFCPLNSFDNNYSNWFLPNKEFLWSVMEEIGFIIAKLTEIEGGRLYLHLLPINRVPQKILPRKKEFMKGGMNED